MLLIAKRFAQLSACLALLAANSSMASAISGPSLFYPRGELKPVDVSKVLVADTSFSNFNAGRSPDLSIKLRNIGTTPVRISGGAALDETDGPYTILNNSQRQYVATLNDSAARESCLERDADEETKIMTIQPGASATIEQPDFWCIYSFNRLTSFAGTLRLRFLFYSTGNRATGIGRTNIPFEFSTP